MDLSDYPYIKYDTFEVTVTVPSRGNPIGIVDKYCEHHNTQYIYQLKNNGPLKLYFPERNKTNVWVLII